MRKLVLAAAAALTVLLAAGCGGTAAPPPAAGQLAHKIPGCHGYLTKTPSVLATGDVVCDEPGGEGGAGIEVVTFASMSSEQKWILAQGNVYGCCVEGHLWAADYYAQANEFPRIIKAIGGRPVTG